MPQRPPRRSATLPPSTATLPRFYVDCCGFEHERLWASTRGERTDVLPYYKPLSGA